MVTNFAQVADSMFEKMRSAGFDKNQSITHLINAVKNLYQTGFKDGADSAKTIMRENADNIIDKMFDDISKDI